MRPTTGPLKKLLTLAVGSVFAVQAQAQLKALDDSELSNVTGQALLTVDALTYNSFEFTRLNIGADIKILTNADELRLGGNYARNGQMGNDTLINNFALGRIKNANSPNAVIDPFQIQDPYVEFAFKNNAAGVRELVGLRVGFGKALGYLSGDIQSLTGTLDGRISGASSIAKDFYMQAHNLNGFTCLFDMNCLQLSLAGDTPIYADIGLVKSGTGEATSIRADTVGIPKDSSMKTDATGLIAALIPTLSKVNNCQTLGVAACFDLGLFKSIFIGKPGGTDVATDGVSGIFFSHQNQTVPWQDLGNSGKFVNAQSGAWTNIAKSTGIDGKDIYPIMLNLYDALRGTAREPSCMGARAAGC